MDTKKGYDILTLENLLSIKNFFSLTMCLLLLKCFKIREQKLAVIIVTILC